ncbi:MAG TPA: hypothetical protein VFZ76_03135 [Anaerolineales bacterium]
MSLANEYAVLGVLLGVAFLHGLFYVFLMPPWQHYDEPTHFEYAWLMANRPGVPQAGDYDQPMRRQVAVSMIEHGFFRDLNFTPDLNPEDRPIWIGIEQLNDPPLYYALVALPLRALDFLDVTDQLYVARITSVLLFVVTILAAWGVVREMTSPGNPLRWAFPASVALISGFANFMTAVSNDVGAVALFSLFLWGSVRLIKRGFSWLGFAWVASTAILCLYTKSTVYWAVPLAPAVLLFGLLQGRWRRIAWALLLAGVLIGSALIFSWGDAATWYRSTDQSAPTRAASPEAVHGKYVLQIDSRAQVNPRWHRPLFQPIPGEVARDLAGKTVTLGAWMWASQAFETSMPALNDGTSSYSRGVTLGTEPTFFAFQANLPQDAWRMWVSISPQLKPQEENVSVYYDGLVLVEGERTAESLPSFDDPDGSTGKWNGEPFENLLRNASAERGGPRIDTRLEKISATALPDFSGPSFAMSYFLDWAGAQWHYVMAGGRLFRTFWGQFGWGQAPLLGHKPYRVLLIATLIGIAGTVIALWRRRKVLPWTIIFLLGVVMAVVWAATILRGLSHLSVTWFWIPVARYGYPAIIPTLLILSVGWLEVLRLCGRILPVSRGRQFAIYLGLLLTLEVWSVVSIIKFYF